MPNLPFLDPADGGSTPPAALARQDDASGVGPPAMASWPPGTLQDVGDAILHTMVYADLFDYPLTTEEIHRYLTGYSAPLSLVEEHLTRNGRLAEHLTSASHFWFLAGREHLVDLRLQREAFSRGLWPEARRYGRLIAAMPFVRLVSITGSLAMHNVRHPRDDIDLLIVTAENRVWLGRGLVILVVHLARRFGIELCPNYVLAEHHLQLGEPSLFIAHELAQLLPLHGLHVYRRLLEGNAWIADYLPNASPRRSEIGQIGPLARRGQGVIETLMGGRLGDRIERLERERKIPQLRRIAIERGGSGTTYTAELCKGHIDDHAAAVHNRYTSQLAALGL